MDYKYKKIMIIDDNSVDLYVTSTLVIEKKLSSEILQFNNSLKALNYISANLSNPSNLPDLILLDLYMPLLDGFEFLTKLEELNSEHMKTCKLYIVSSSIDDHDIKKCKSNQLVSAFTSKPISESFLQTL